MRLINVTCLCCAALAASGIVRAADFKVIANPSVSATELSSADLKDIFLETKTSLAGTGHVEPVLAKGGAVHEAFLKACVDKTDAALSTYYRSLVFTGKAAMP